jgi:hypothetical protein
MEVTRVVHSFAGFRVDTKVLETSYPAHAESNHKAYFGEIWLDDDTGMVDKDDVFYDEEGAKEYAIRRASLQVARLNRNIKAVKERIKELKS